MEAAVLTRLNHPNVVRIFETGFFFREALPRAQTLNIEFAHRYYKPLLLQYRSNMDDEQRVRSAAPILSPIEDRLTSFGESRVDRSQVRPAENFPKVASWRQPRDSATDWHRQCFDGEHWTDRGRGRTGPVR